MTPKLEWVCHECGCDRLNWNGDDGSYYCDNCNNKADIVDTALDDHHDGGIYSMSNRRSRPSQLTPAEPISQVRVRLTPALRLESTIEDMGNILGPTDPTDFGSYSKGLSYNDYYSEIRLRYVLGFQVMIQLQCKALVEKFNVNPLVVGIVGPIWLRFLASTKIMADGWADEAVLDSESQLQGEAAEFKPHYQHRNEPHNMLGKRAVIVWHKSLRSSIPLSYSLGFSFLVCHIARENVLPTDIVKWTIEGKIPYFSAFLEIEEQLGPPTRACPITSSSMFRPIQVITAQKIESMAAFIAQKVGLQLPSVNFNGISSRFLNQLGIPVEEILPEACRIYQWSMPPELYISANKSRTPTRACVMAILIVTIRILYDLNGFGKWEMSLSRVSEASGAESADTHVDLSPHDSKMDAKDLLKILEMKYNELKDNYDYSVDLSSYLQYCKDVVFAGSGSSLIEHEEERLIEELWSFYQNQQDIDRHSKMSQSKENSTLKLKQTKKSDEENPILLLNSIKDEAIKLLKQDMEEHRFSYISPRRRIKRHSSYLIYSRRKNEGAYAFAVHADYYILLRACAKVAQVEIRVLHCAVLDLERRLKRLEDRIDRCLDVNSTPDNLSSSCSSEVEQVFEDGGY